MKGGARALTAADWHCLLQVVDRTAAEQLRQYSIVLPVAAREKLRDPDEFYAQDLIGSLVFMLVGDVVGRERRHVNGCSHFNQLSTAVIFSYSLRDVADLPSVRL